MTHFEKGELVYGKLYGQKDAPGNYITGTVIYTDPQGDPLVSITNVSERSGQFVTGKIGDEFYLEGSSVVGVTHPVFGSVVPPRAKILREAEGLITGERNAAYGKPTENFADIAKVWNVYLGPKLREGAEISAADTAWMMVGLKMVRSIASPTRDNWVDAAGYAACGAECDIAEGVIEDGSI